MNVNGFGRIFNLQMLVGLVKQTSTTLAFEIIDDAGQRVALQKIAANLERKGTRPALPTCAFQNIRSFSLDRTEVGGPKNPILPLINGADLDRGTGQRLLARQRNP